MTEGSRITGRAAGVGIEQFRTVARWIRRWVDENLLEIATIFLDENLRIKNFTPGMADIFSVREGDRGRPLTDIVGLLAYDDLQRDVTRVLRELTVLERELELHDRAASFIMRIRPYQTVDRVIDGVVLTFVDVTERKKAERAQRASERRFTAIVNQAAVGITEADIAGRAVRLPIAGGGPLRINAGTRSAEACWMMS